MRSLQENGDLCDPELILLEALHELVLVSGAAASGEPFSWIKMKGGGAHSVTWGLLKMNEEERLFDLPW